MFHRLAMGVFRRTDRARSMRCPERYTKADVSVEREDEVVATLHQYAWQSQLDSQGPSDTCVRKQTLVGLQIGWIIIIIIIIIIIA